MKKLLATLALSMVIGAPAFAQGKVNVVQEADKTVFRKKTVIDFTDVAVEGELTKPEGSYAILEEEDLVQEPDQDSRQLRA
ncbi:MAG: hypothetical protein QM723_04935 [Myxococcaceae bacterium]